MIDTLFSLAEAHLFMQLVEWFDRDPASLPPGKTYADLYRCGGRVRVWGVRVWGSLAAPR